MLGHRISEKGIKVDRTKIEAFEKLAPPTNVKGMRSFLGHVEFYKRFIKDFSKITKPLSNLLVQGASFDFNDDFQKAFSLLKEKLVIFSIVVALDWDLPFELMCDTISYVVGVVLGQQNDIISHVIYYASKTLNDAQLKYVLRPSDIYNFMTLLPKDYYLILSSDAKNLFRPFLMCMKRWNCSFF